jgi:ABC-type glycerol-3-phosphate transport system permease component
MTQPAASHAEAGVSGQEGASQMADRRKKYRLSRRLWRTCLYVLAITAAVIAVAPLVIALGTAVKAPGSSTSDLSIFPAHPVWSNFSDVISGTSLLTYVKNSLIVTSATAVVTLICASLAAYAFSRMRFLLRDFLYMAFLMGLTLPIVVVLVPLFQTERVLHLFNTYGALIFPYTGFAMPFGILLLKNYFDSVPREMEEAARIDGAALLRIFVSIVIPLVKPALVTVAIFQAVSSWNEFLLALLFMTEDSMRTVPLAVIPFIGQYGQQTEFMFASMLLITIPPIILFVSMQRYFVSGLTAGAIKG